MSHVDDRYHISDGQSFIEAAGRRDEALRAAQRKANAVGHSFTVFDTMARRGHGQLWTLHPGANPDGACFVIPPTQRRAPAGGGRS